MNQRNLSLKSGELRERYYNLLLKRGFAYYNGRVKITKLYTEFTKFFSHELLEKLGCQIKSAGRNWLSRITEKVLADVLYHPIRHLLLLNLFGLNAKDLFKSFVEFKPFGSPPYPCLNKISTHYGKLKIKSCEVFDNLTKGEKFRRPIAIFSCNCGFIYQRLGPDKSDEDKFRFDSVRQYGDLWEKELVKHWANLNLSLSEIARRFGTINLLIARHALRLDPPRNSEGTRSLQGYDRHQNPRKYFSENLEENRSRFLEVLKKHPKANRKLLMKTASFVLLWLYRNDKKWLKNHLPKQTKVTRKIDRYDWKKIDKELSRQIKKVSREIRQVSDKLLRVSITEIIRRIGQKAWVEKREDKLPSTTKVVNESLESLEDFMIRKLLWAENKFIEEKIIPTRNQLIRRAMIENTTTHNSIRIQSEIEASLKQIQRVVNKTE